jgi:hypothetical protein
VGNVSDFEIDPKVGQALDQLDDEKSLGIALSEFSRTIIDRPENHRKIRDSFAGHAVNLQNTVILRELRLWCCRIWEQNGNSLPVVGAHIKSYAQKIIEVRRIAHPDWPEELLQSNELGARMESFTDRIEQIKRRQVLSELRVTRDEHFAHLLRGISGARRKRQLASPENEGYTYNEVLKLADESVALIAEAIFIWRFHSHNDENTRKMLRKYYEGYWSLLPVFSDLEARGRKLRSMKPL